MNIRKGTTADVLSLTRRIQNKHIEFISVDQMKEDIKNNRLYLLENNNNLIAMVSIIYDTNYNYNAMKRLIIFNKKNCGKGYANILINYLSNRIENIGCTPWTDNFAMQKLLERNGFEFQYLFNEKWMFYLKKTIDF